MYFLTALSHNSVFSLKFELRLHSWAVSKLSLGSQAAELLEGESRVGGGGSKSPVLMGLYHTTFQGLVGTSGSELQMTMTVLAKLCQAKYLGDRSLQSNQIKFSRHLQSAIFLKVKDE